MRPGSLTRRDPDDSPLITDAELEHLRLITLQHRNHRHTPGAVVTGGARLTRWRGHGMELHDVRPYQPGDDMRHLDWRAMARSGKPITKVFVEERARSLFLLIDRRPTMMFGTRRELKAATAVRAAAILAFAALAEREPVCGLVIDDEPRWFPPTRTLDGLLQLLHAAAAPPRRPRTSSTAPAVDGPGAMMKRFGEQLPPGITCCLISDFHDIIEGRSSVTEYLPAGERASARHDVVAIQVIDDAELRLPEAGVLRLASPDGRATTVVDTRDPELRRRYQAEITRRIEALRRQCEQDNIRLISIDNHSPLLTRLEALL